MQNQPSKWSLEMKFVHILDYVRLRQFSHFSFRLLFDTPLVYKNIEHSNSITLKSSTYLSASAVWLSGTHEAPSMAPEL